jgi:hypothetical protein
VYRVADDGESLTKEEGHEDLVREALIYYQGADYMLGSGVYRAQGGPRNALSAVTR